MLRDKVRFFLFGARKPERNVILENKPVYDNFLAVCSLPFFKPRSVATQQLVKILRTCQLHSAQKEIRNLKPIEQLQDIAVLHLIKLALHQWCQDREKVSIRTTKVRQFANLMDTKQRSIVTYYNNYYSCYINQRQHTACAAAQPLPSLRDCDWKNTIQPFLNIDLRDYLSSYQKFLFNDFSENLHKGQPLLPMPKFCAAFFMPVMQCFSDIDGIDLMWDYLSMYINYINAGMNIFSATPLIT